MSRVTKNNNHEVTNSTPNQNKFNTDHWVFNNHSKQLYHHIYICNRYLPQLNDLSMISLGTRVTVMLLQQCSQSKSSSNFWIEWVSNQFPIYHFFTKFQKSISLLKKMRIKSISHSSISTIIKCPNNLWIEWGNNIPSNNCKLYYYYGYDKQ